MPMKTPISRLMAVVATATRAALRAP